MGDAAHMGSPRTAIGAHVCLLDAAALKEVFTTYRGRDQIDKAIQAYAPGGVQRARELYECSKDVSRPIAYNPAKDERLGRR